MWANKNIFRISVFLIIVLGGDLIFGLLLKKLYFCQKSGDRHAITYALDSTKAELLIFGNSRATHHYIPEVFENATHLRCFNTGRDGEGISFNYALLVGITERYIPSCIILDFNTESLYINRNGTDNLNSLVPYYQSNRAIKVLLSKRRHFERVKQFSFIYPFNSTILSSLIGMESLYETEGMKGFLPLIGKMGEPAVPNELNLDKLQIDSTKLNDFINFINHCKKRGIELVVVQSPRFSIVKNDKIKVMADSILKVAKIPFLDYKNDTSFLNHSFYFKDGAHLNKEGAYLFSKKLSSVIASSLNKN
jgi:hypothetical protein